MKINNSNWLFLALLSSQPVFAAEELDHHRIKVGESFLFAVKAKASGREEANYAPRLDAWGVNSAGGVIFTVAQGPKIEVKTPGEGTTILRTVYAIGKDECATDLITGASLLKGAACGIPMKESWTFTSPTNRSYSCNLLQPSTEHLSLAGGEFATMRIACSHTDNEGNSIQYSYWYAASIGAMTKSVERTLDKSGVEISLVTAELVSYQPHALRR